MNNNKKVRPNYNYIFETHSTGKSKHKWKVLKIDNEKKNKVIWVIMW